MEVPRPPRTRITSDLVADDVLIGDAVDKILLANAALQRIHRQIVRRQRALRAAVSNEQWRRYMLAEEALNDYHATAVSTVARVFYQAGRQAGRRRR